MPQASGGSGVGLASQFTACASTRAVSSLPICSSPWNNSAWASRWLRNAAWRNRFGCSWPMIVLNGMGFDLGQAGPPRPQPGLHDPVDRARHDVFGGCTVHHAHAARVLSGDAEIAPPYGFVERGMFPVEAVKAAGPALASEADRHRDVQQDGQVRRKAGGGETVQAGDDGGAKPAPVALIGHGRVGKAVAEHHGALLQRRADGLGHVLGAAGQVEQELAASLHAVVLGVQKDSPDLLADGRAAGLARLNDLVAERPEAPGESLLKVLLLLVMVFCNSLMSFLLIRKPTNLTLRCY